jgi:hypothetical protein
VTLDPAQVEGEPQKPFWERAREFASSIPVEEQERFPVDGSQQLDHYVYGVPKRPVRCCSEFCTGHG